METTLDGLLNRRVMLEQPAKGYRVAVDTVLLASAVPAVAGERVLDLGCGVGGVMLCLAARVPGLAITGIESDPAMVDLCRGNIARNDFAGGCDVMPGDATALPPHFAASFDHVVMNPPYHDETRHGFSDDAQKRAANTEKDGDLAKWLASAAGVLAPGGRLALIHRADRLEEILRLLATHFGDTEIQPIAPKENAPAKRVIVSARKGGVRSPVRKPDFVLHKADGGFTEPAENILRHAAVM